MALGMTGEPHQVKGCVADFKIWPVCLRQEFNFDFKDEGGKVDEAITTI
jgi:hypothetical protein